MTKKQESVTLSLSMEDKRSLERIALEMECMYGNEPNISKLIREIAVKDIILIREGKPSQPKRVLIKDAINCIQDALTILLNLI